jgi:hypothetical protein
MKPRCLCAMVLALALPVLGQTEPQLEPLVPQDAPWLQKNKNKKKPPAKKQKPAPDASLPPLAPLTKAREVGAVGVLVLGALPDGVVTRMTDGLQAVAKLAPGAKQVSALDAPAPCTDQACWVTAGVAANADSVVVASYAKGSLHVRVVDVKARKELSDAQQAGVSEDPAEATAWAQALACKLMVPAGCSGRAVVEAPFGVTLELDGQPLRSSEVRVLPVGVHTLVVKEGGTEETRSLPILLDGSAAISVASRKAPPPAAVATPVPAAAVVASAPPAPKRTWTKTAGYAAAGAAVVAAGVGAYFGAKSKSEINSAEDAYHANGGAWNQSDLDKLNSGNSKARTANALFVASGVLLASAAVLTFAF